MIFGFNVQSDDKELFMGSNLGDERVRPNVVIIMDSSGSMNTIVFYPKNGLDRIPGTADDGYHYLTTYSGSVDGFTDDINYMDETEWHARWITSADKAEEFNQGDLTDIGGKHYWTGCYAGDGSGTNFQVGSNGKDYFNEGDTVVFRDETGTQYDAVATVGKKYLDASNETWFELTDIKGGPITVGEGRFQKSPDSKNWEPVILQLYGTVDNAKDVRYPENYMNWLYLHATEEQRDAVSHFSSYATFDVGYTPTPQLSNCATPGNDDLNGSNPRILDTFTRIQSAREVICKVATDSNKIVKLGLFKFDNVNNDGGELMEGLNDMSDESSLLVAYKNSVWKIFADGYTPLAETLADVWYYIKPGPNSKTYWPAEYEILKDTVTHSVENPVTPVDWWCQNNYVVVMTDGESTKDRMDSTKYADSIFMKTSVQKTYPYTESWESGWGDPDANDDKDYGYLPKDYLPSNTYCPNFSCWYTSSGSDLLDDVAYFIRNVDMFPDSHYGDDSDTGWPGQQKIYTYTIGFNADNDMLRQTAINGEGAYYTATNYEELVEAFKLVITGINLRNFAFSAITAPKKTATATNAQQTVSYVGYFMPSSAASIWEGHLLAFELEDSWGFDTDGSGSVEPEEFVYPDETTCMNSSMGVSCERWVNLAIGHEWDAADKVPADRSLFTHNVTPTNIAFTTDNAGTILPLIDPLLTLPEAEQIIDHIREPRFGDVFHSDVGFVGPPPYGKQFISNIDPPNPTDGKYVDFWTDNQSRQRVIYTGTNDGILHMLYADGVDAGKEIWGFIPDEVLPSLKRIVLGNKHTYTVDGRLSATDIWYTKAGGSTNEWGTVLVFGLRQGGNAYYAMDITTIGAEPQMLWKFKDADHSGESWGKPSFGRIKYVEGGNEVDKWVVFLTGGFGFNSEHPTNHKGKALFVVDAATGDLLWSIAYDPSNGAPAGSPGIGEQEKVDVAAAGGNKYLTASGLFNFPIPASLTAIDRDNDGYTDTIYFGNMGGHLFKTDISKTDRSEWQTYVMFKRSYIVDKGSASINSISEDVFKVSVKAFEVGDGIMGKTSYATGYITALDNSTRELTVVTTSGAFQVDETIVCRTYDPIFLSPAVAYDTCYQLWVSFGTGDRDRPRTNVTSGRFVSMKDNGATNVIEDSGGNAAGATLEVVSFGADGIMQDTQLSDNSNGWYLDFPDTGEKIFDPEPVILPDTNLIPHIFFNTYQPPLVDSGPKTNPCNAPDEGVMKIYDIALNSCGTTEIIAGEVSTGRIAGGGIYQGKEYIIYKSKSGDVADVPGGEGGNFIAEPKRLPYAGGILFWKEKKR
jgi:hypothetical protein